MEDLDREVDQVRNQREDEENFDEHNRELTNEPTFPSQKSEKLIRNILDMEQFHETLTEIENFSKFANEEEKSMIIDNLMIKIRELATEYQKVQEEITNRKSSMPEEKMSVRCEELEKIEDLQQQNAQLSNKINGLLIQLSAKQEQSINQRSIGNRQLESWKSKHSELLLQIEQDKKTIKDFKAQIQIFQRYAVIQQKFNQHKFVSGRNVPRINQQVKSYSQEITTVSDEKQLKEVKQALKYLKMNTIESKEFDDQGLDMISEKTEEDFEGPSMKFIKKLEKCESSLSFKKSELNEDSEQIKIESLASICDSPNQMQYEIENLKNYLSKRSEVQNSLGQPQQHWKENKRAASYLKAFNCLSSLDSNRIANIRQITELELQIEQLNHTIHQDNEENQQNKFEGQKVKQLMEKIQISEQQRAHLLVMNEKLNQRLTEKQSMMKEFGDSSQDSSVQHDKLICELNEMKFCLDQEIKVRKELENELNHQYEQKTELREQIENLSSKKQEFSERNSQLPQIVNENMIQITKLTHNLQQAHKMLKQSEIKQRSATQRVLQMERQHEKFIKELQSKDGEKQRQFIQLKNQNQDDSKNIEKLSSEKQSISLKLNKKSEQTEKYKYDISILQKTIKDLQYMNEILKKDVFSLQIIKKTDWGEEIEKEVRHRGDKENQRKNMSVYSSDQPILRKDDTYISKIENRYKDKEEIYTPEFQLQERFSLPISQKNYLIHQKSFGSSSIRNSTISERRRTEYEPKIGISSIWGAESRCDKFEINPKRSKNHHSFYIQTSKQRQSKPIAQLRSKSRYNMI